MIESINDLLIDENEEHETDDENEEDETDDENLDSNILYDSDEECSTKYTIILCDLYNPLIHGDCEYFVLFQFLVHYKYKYFDINFINSTCKYLNKQYKLLISQDNFITNKINHPIYKNYFNIVSRNNYIKPEIAQCIYLKSYECIAILKTFWIRLIQRTWKKVYKERQNIINKKMQLSAIRNRELFIRHTTFPSLKGMMYYLKK
jgi:hypothetical protein